MFEFDVFLFAIKLMRLSLRFGFCDSTTLKSIQFGCLTVLKSNNLTI